MEKSRSVRACPRKSVREGPGKHGSYPPAKQNGVFPGDRGRVCSVARVVQSIGRAQLSDLARGAIQELLDSRTGRASERQAHEEILGRIEDLKAVIEDLNARLAGREAARHAGGANR